jgi:hypothetical protein
MPRGFVLGMWALLWLPGAVFVYGLRVGCLLSSYFLSVSCYIPVLIDDDMLLLKFVESVALMSC